MSWGTTRRILVVCGALYLFALVPASIRPQWTASPFHKPNQTINVAGASPQGELPAGVHDQIKNACKAAYPLRPFMGSAQHIRVIVTWDGKPVAVRGFDCELYT